MIPQTFHDSDGRDRWADLPSVRDEVLALFEMLGRNGDTPESIRNLIGVPADVEAALRERAAESGDERSLEKVLKFRRRVLKEFDRLVEAAETFREELIAKI